MPVSRIYRMALYIRYRGNPRDLQIPVLILHNVSHSSGVSQPRTAARSLIVNECNEAFTGSAVTADTVALGAFSLYPITHTVVHLPDSRLLLLLLGNRLLSKQSAAPKPLPGQRSRCRYRYGTRNLGASFS